MRLVRKNRVVELMELRTLRHRQVRAIVCLNKHVLERRDACVLEQKRHDDGPSLMLWNTDRFSTATRRKKIRPYLRRLSKQNKPKCFALYT